MPVKKDEKILVALPEFSSVDEIASGIVLSRILRNLGAQVNLYIGETNYALRLQKFLPTEDVKLYQPNTLPNEVRVNMKLDDGQVIKGIRWEQDKDELHLFIESETDISTEPEITFANKNSFDKLYLVGTYDVKRLENIKELEKYTDLPTKPIFISNRLAPANISGNDEGLVNTKVESISELIVVIANQYQIDLTDKDLHLLLKGAQFARQLSGNIFSPFTQTMIEELKQKNLDPGEKFSLEFSSQEWRELADFWKDENVVGSNDISYEDLLALLHLSWQLNPLIPSNGAYLPSKAEGKSYYRELGTPDRIVFVSDDLRYTPEKDVTAFSYRRFEHFLIGWYQREGQKNFQSSKQTQQQQPVQAKEQSSKPDTEKKKDFVPLKPAS